MPPKKRFVVVFTNHNYEEVWAHTEKEAKILAQAKQIEKGNSYSISHVKTERELDVFKSITPQQFALRTLTKGKLDKKERAKILKQGKIALSKHKFDKNDPKQICKTCGCSSLPIAYFNWDCEKTLSNI